MPNTIDDGSDSEIEQSPTLNDETRISDWTTKLANTSNDEQFSLYKQIVEIENVYVIAQLLTQEQMIKFLDNAYLTKPLNVRSKNMLALQIVNARDQIALNRTKE